MKLAPRASPWATVVTEVGGPCLVSRTGAGRPRGSAGQPGAWALETRRCKSGGGRQGGGLQRRGGAGTWDLSPKVQPAPPEPAAGPLRGQRAAGRTEGPTPCLAAELCCDFSSCMQVLVALSWGRLTQPPRASSSCTVLVPGGSSHLLPLGLAQTAAPSPAVSGTPVRPPSPGMC